MYVQFNKSLVVREPAFYICKNKDADHSYCTADKRICFRYIDITITLFLNPEFKLLAIFCGCTTGLCRTWSETPKTGFLTARLICLTKGYLQNFIFQMGYLFQSKL